MRHGDLRQVSSYRTTDNLRQASQHFTRALRTKQEARRFKFSILRMKHGAVKYFRFAKLILLASERLVSSAIG